MSGWIKLHRQIWDHWLYTERRVFSKYEAWLDIVMLANHSDNKFLLGAELIDVERGSFITSELKLMDRWGWSKTKLRNFLELLEKEQMILKKSDKKKTTLKVLNYSVYQGSEDHEETTGRLQKDTNKNDKNDKKEKNNTSSRNKPKVYSEVDSYYRMALYFHQKIMEHAEINKKDHLVRNADMQKWADDFRKIVEIDKRDTKEMKQIIDWATSDPFWQLNILSPDKLRKQYTQLGLKMDAPARGKQVTRDQRNRDLLQQKMREAESLEQTRDNQIAIDYLNGLPGGGMD